MKGMAKSNSSNPSRSPTVIRSPVLLVSSLSSLVVASQTFRHQFIVKRLESRVLDDGQNVDQAGRLLARH